MLGVLEHHGQAKQWTGIASLPFSHLNHSMKLKNFMTKVPFDWILAFFSEITAKASIPEKCIWITFGAREKHDSGYWGKNFLYSKLQDSNYVRALIIPQSNATQEVPEL